MQFFKSPRFNFIGIRRKVMPISLILILIGLGSVAIHKGFNTSIDFAGGTLVEVQFDPAVSLPEVRDVIEGAGFTGAEITNFGVEREVHIKIKAIVDASEAARQIEAKLKE
mgnify:FL=1